MRYVQVFHGLFVRIWPRVIGFSDTPSLLALALVANFIALIPNPLRAPKEIIASPYRTLAFEQNSQAGKGKQL